MARPRVPVEHLAKAYAVAQESGVDQAAEKTGVSRRTVHSVIWAMETVPQIIDLLKTKNPTDTTGGAGCNATDELGACGCGQECTSHV